MEPKVVKYEQKEISQKSTKKEKQNGEIELGETTRVSERIIKEYERKKI